MTIRNLTKQQAIEKGLSRETDDNLKTSHCPECGCPWFGNKNMCGEGHRVCGDCYQDWWINIDYEKVHELRELPELINLNDVL